MAEKMLLLEQVNLFLGNHDPEDSNHVKLQSLGLPTLEKILVSHLGGGAGGEVEYSMNAFRPMQPTFKLAGYSKASYRLMAVGTNESQDFTAYGILRNKVTGVKHQAKAVFNGIVSRLAPDAFDRTSTFGHDHTVAEVTRYQLDVDGDEWFAWDAFKPLRRRFGVDELARDRILLGIE